MIPTFDPNLAFMAFAGLALVAIFALTVVAIKNRTTSAKIEIIHDPITATTAVRTEFTTSDTAPAPAQEARTDPALSDAPDYRSLPPHREQRPLPPPEDVPAQRRREPRRKSQPGTSLRER